MVSLLKTTARLASALFATGLLVAAGGNAGRPGTVNYAEGTVTVAGQSIGSGQIGQTEVAAGQVIETARGKAEMLLTPGVLLRLSDNSALRMVEPSLTDTRVELLKGEAMVEAQSVQKENRIDVIDRGVDTLIEKNGIYRFDTDPARVSVFDGKVKVLSNDGGIEVGKGKELALGTDVKARKFDRDQTDALYAWSRLRSGYLAEANESSAETIIVGGPGWYGSGWYWNPWYSTYSFLPGAGYLTSPFGFGFYSPGYLYGGGFYPYRSYVRPIPGRGWNGPAGGGFVQRGGGGFHGPVGGGMRAPAGGGARSLGRGARM
jgi:hypothetical protein